MLASGAACTTIKGVYKMSDKPVGGAGGDHNMCATCRPDRYGDDCYVCAVMGIYKRENLLEKPSAPPAHPCETCCYSDTNRRTGGPFCFSHESGVRPDVQSCPDWRARWQMKKI